MLFEGDVLKAEVSENSCLVRETKRESPGCYFITGRVSYICTENKGTSQAASRNKGIKNKQLRSSVGVAASLLASRMG